MIGSFDRSTASLFRGRGPKTTQCFGFMNKKFKVDNITSLVNIVTVSVTVLNSEYIKYNDKSSFYSNGFAASLHTW